MSFYIRKPVLGLALGGGGARGLAHIGVLKVLQSSQWTPDLLSGTSMGAIIAIMAAFGFSPDEIEKEAEKITKLGNLVKMIGDGLTDTRFAFGRDAVQRYFKEIFEGDKQFSDLKIPAAITAVDLVSASEITLSSGSLAQAINASMALPGLVEPVKKEKMRLVDGGSLNNVPADLVRSMGAEVVIAVDVSPDVTDEEFWREQKLPQIAAANWRNNAIMVANITKAKLKKADTDLIIKPQIPANITTLTGFKNMQEIITAGEKAASNILPEIENLMKDQFSLGQRGLKPAKAMEL